MKKISHLAIILLGVFVAVFILYKHFTTFYIVAKFQELRPHKGNLPVYYKGLKIGYAHEVRHSKDLGHTYMDITISKKGMMLPANSTVLLKKEKRNKKERDFLEIIYPSEPEKILLSRGSEIKGVATVDVEEYLTNQHPDELAQIKENLLKSSENLEYMLSSLGDVFSMLYDILEENRENIKITTDNFASTTGNIDKVSGKFDNSINQQKLSESVNNLHTTFENIENITENLNQTTGIFNLDLSPEITKSLNNTQDILEDGSAILRGLRKALSKTFGGFRVFFGKTVDE